MASTNGHGKLSINETFSGSKILITGATGFIGSVVLEKMLRSCPDIATIYVLMRSRGGTDVHDRVKNLFRTPLFKKITPELQNKVVAISGDVSKPSLGLSDEDRAELCLQVTIVFHVAASINFNATLQSAVRTNLMGTKRILELCYDMPAIKALVFVSSAFCNSMLGSVLVEQVYPPDRDPNEIIELMQVMSPQAIVKATPK
ncbi:hypothetical protein L9F63_005275 [Diploptera punctata]|uniref:Fatty acyl-CoA reductase n=1 Tax=Diploptera punctata TaxID=6984 RepID=A0AAD8E6F7_DIPPU|nr:hypothetical protein L9F63_005275 [Diploptera punctata]